MKVIAPSLLCLLSANTVVAADGPANPDSVEEIVVTGTRAAGRTELNSPVPVAVYGAQQMLSAGFPDVGRALNAIAPSINMSHSQTSPSAANTRSITMKGMAPDQVLVLVNGKRWQSSSVLVFNSAVGRGSAPYDLGAIPMSAVQRIEVLGSGAAAQYGTDAIAGVVNIILNSSADISRLAVQSGVTDEGDGMSYDVNATQGWHLSDTGHLTLSGDARYQDYTNRAVPDPRTGGRIDQQVGDPRAVDISVAADAAYPLSARWDAYGSLLGSRRDSTSVPTFRLPGASVLYPDGYLPKVNPLIWNATAIAGVRGGLDSGISVDLSNSFGYNNAQFDVSNTANNALGAASPTRFDSGSLRYATDTVNLTLGRRLDDWWLPGNLAAGIEYRTEYYAITDGEPLSYEQGGAQGFPGFAPRIPVDNSRNAVSAFTDIEIQPLDWLKLGAAGRYDHYSDFGNAVTWKATLRTDVTGWLALRGSLGTGFRAPSLQQQYFSSVVSQISTTGDLVRTGTYQVRDPIAAALGAKPLEPEKSRDYSASVVINPLPALLLTADWYNIDVTDRIILSDQLRGPQVSAVLAANGVTDVQQVQFFTNAAHTRTRGYEVAAKYSATLTAVDSVETSLQYGQYRTTLEQLDANPVLPDLVLLGPISRGLLIGAQPTDKLTSSVTLRHQQLAATVDIDHYGSWTSAPLGVTQRFSGKTLLDLTADISLGKNISLAAGVLNATNVYPDPVTGGAAIGLSYGDEAPFGVNGRTYFLRIQVAR